MTEKPLSEKSSNHPQTNRPLALVLAVLGGLIGIGVLILLLVQSVEITVTPGSTDDPPLQPPSATEGLSDTDPGSSPAAENTSPDSASSTPTPNTAGDGEADGTSEIEASDGEGATATLPTSAAAATTIGGLRVQNQTQHPIRIVLISQQTRPADSENSTQGYGEPVHWDFAPGEGAASGLLLALPDQSLEIGSGDVLAAFAQDGSQRYWGPFVVGSTGFPRWDDEAQVWTLTLAEE